jgi:hypothetical protein
MRFSTSVLCQTFSFLLQMPKFRLFKFFALKFYKLRPSVVDAAREPKVFANISTNSVIYPN